MGTETQSTAGTQTQTHEDAMTQTDLLEQRMRRIETRLVQLMIHLGMDPYTKMYDSLDRSARRTHTQD